MTEGPLQHSSRRMSVALGALTVWLILWPAMLTFNVGDWPSPHQFPHNEPTTNACGVVGAWCAYYLQYYIGDGVYPLLLFATLATVMRLVRGAIGNAWERVFGLALVATCTSASAHLIAPTGAGALPIGHGGVFGFAIGELLRESLSSMGTIIVLATTLFVGLVFATEGWVLKLPMAAKRLGDASGHAVSVARKLAGAATLPRLIPVSEGISSAERSAILDHDPRPETKPPVEAYKKRDDEKLPNALERSEDRTRSEPIRPSTSSESSKNNATQTQSMASCRESTTAAPPDHRALKQIAAATIASPSVPPRLAPSNPIVRFPSAQDAAKAEPYPKQIENWTLPPLDLLHEPEYGFNAQQEVFVREQARILEKTLEEFRLDAHVVEIDTGPVITMFELKLGAGIKVSQIASLSNDMARALKAHAIRVVAPISGKNTVGIEVPNLKKEKVRLKELMVVSGKKASEMGLPLFLGKDAGGAALVTDLTRMPHLLIAGTTGSGKSVCINAIILSLLMTKRPDHVKLILVDPKMVEMSQFKDVPHLMCPIVTDMVRAEKVLEWVVTRMDERYEILAEARVKNIDAYNQLGAEELYARLKPSSDMEKAQINIFLPYIVVMIDELADLMMTAAKEVEHHLSRMAQKSRAVGIHIIVATQRPEVKVVTGLIKSNLPSRVCFRVASRMDSRIVLDQNGGEVLMGQGDMLFLPPGSHKLVRAQGSFLEETEVQAVLENLASRAKPEFHPELMRIKTQDDEVDLSLRDPLFDQAVRIILESKRGSVSLLQRRLTIGYSRASRLIDMMADAGIVGDYKGSQAREVLMTLDEWESLHKHVSVDRSAGYEADDLDEVSPRRSK